MGIFSVAAIVVGASLPFIYKNLSNNLSNRTSDKVGIFSHLPKRSTETTSLALVTNSGDVLAEISSAPEYTVKSNISQSSDNYFMSFKVLGKYGQVLESFIDKYAKNGVAQLIEKAEVVFFEDVSFKKRSLFEDKATFKEDVKVDKDIDVDGDIKLDGDLDLSGDLSVDGMIGLKNETSNPNGGNQGQMYFNTSNNQIYVYNGTSWQQVGQTYSVATDSGLQLVNNQFGLITCSSNQILKYLGGAWQCATDAGGVGSDTFLSLTDTPSTFSGQGNRLVRVGVGESSLEFLDVSSWDQNSSDDLTTSNYNATLDGVYLNTGESASGGDVVGPYSNLQLAAAVVGANEIASSGVTAGTYGAATSIPVFTVDQDGRVTSASVVSFSGGANITSLGTITSGTWQGSTIDVPFGGTGRTTLTDNGLLYGNGTGALQSVSVGVSGQVLTVNGSSQPIWVNASTLFNNTGSLQISNNLSDLGNTATARINLGLGNLATLNQISLSTTQVSGVLGVANGGIGISSVNSGSLIFGSGGTGALSTLLIGTSNQVLMSNGTNPIWSTIPSGVTDFLSLIDTPNTYSGQAGRFVRVGAGETALEFLDVSGWDQDSSNDLTNSNYAATLDSVYLNTGESASGGDVAGPFSNLQIGQNVVGSSELASSGVTAGTYGASTSIPVLSIDDDGRVTLASNVDITTALNTLYLRPNNNLSDVSNTATARVNLGLGNLSVLNQINLATTQITGTLGLANGGLGISSLNSGALVYGSGGTESLSTLLIGTSNQVLMSNGTNPIWSTIPSGVTDFLSLIDTPNAYTGQSGRFVRVGVGETSLEFTDLGALYWSVNGNTGVTPSNLLGTSDTAALYIGTSAQYRVTILGNGNFGIGTTNPTAQLHLVGSANLGGLAVSSSGVITSGSWNGATITVPYGGTGATSFANNGILYGNGTGALQTVGIGVSGQILSVNSSSQPVWMDISLLGGGSTAGLWRLGGNTGIALSDLLGTADTANLYIGTSGLPRMTVLGTGKIGVGTTNPLELFNIQNGTLLVDKPSMSEVSTISISNALKAKIHKNYAYVTALLSGMYIVDISNKNSPSIVSLYNGGGLENSVDVAGEYAALTSTTTLTILNIANATAPIVVGSVAESNAAAVSIIGKYVYVSKGTGGIDVVDISNPTSPTVIGNFDTAGSATDFVVSGKYIYIADGTNGIVVGDISNPASPTLVGSTDPGDVNNVVVNGRYAYFRNSSAIEIVDLVNPTSPQVLASISVTSPQGLEIAGNYLYVAGSPNSVAIYNIANSTSPSFVSSYTSTNITNDMAISGKYLYTTDTNKGLAITDISGADISSLSAGSIKTTTLDVLNNVIVGSNLDVKNGLNVGFGGILSQGPVSISNLMGTTANSLPAFSIRGGSANGAQINIGTTSTGNYILNLMSNDISRVFVNGEGNVGIGTTNPTVSLQVSGSANIGGLSINSAGVVTSGSWNGATITVPFGGTGASTFTTNGLLYGNGTGAFQSVGVGTSGQILTVNGSSQPTWTSVNSLLDQTYWSLSGNVSSSLNFLGTTNTAPLRIGTSGNEVIRITADGKVGIGITDPSGKFHIADGKLIVNRPSPSLLSSLSMSGPYKLSVYDNYVYIADGTAGVKIVDASTDNLSIASSVNPGGSATDVDVDGNYMYVAIGTSVAVYDILNPTNPILVATKSLGGASSSSTIKIAGKYGYVGSTNFRVVDFSDLNNIRTISTAPLGGVQSVDVQGKYAYVANTTGGFAIVDVSNPYELTIVSSTDPGTTTDVKVVGRYAYLADVTGLKIFDVINPASPIYVSGTEGQYRSLDVVGNNLYLSGYSTFDVFRLTNATTPELATNIGIPGFNTYYDIRAQGNRVFLSVDKVNVTFGVNALQAYDIDGAEVSSLNAGNIKSSSLFLSNDLEVSNNVKIKTGLNVGIGGIQSNGPVSILNIGATNISLEPTFSLNGGSANGASLSLQTQATSNYVLDAKTNGLSRLYIRADGAIAIGNTSNNSISGLLSVGSGATAPFNIASSGEPTLSGTGRHLRFMNLNAEYPGAVLTNLYGATTEPNTNGTMTSDLTVAGTGLTIPMSYYEWTSSQSTTQAYVVALRVTLPQDFDSWSDSGTDDLTVNYMTTDGTVGNNNFSLRVIGPGGTANQYTGSLLANSTWTTTTIDSANFGASGNTAWDAAGESAVIYLRLESKSNNVVRVGDITLKYKSKW